MSKEELEFIESVVLWGILKGFEPTQLSSVLNLSVDEIINVLDKLVDKGYLKREWRDGEFKYSLTSKGLNAIIELPKEAKELLDKLEERSLSSSKYVKEIEPKRAEGRGTFRPTSLAVASVLLCVFGVFGVISSILSIGLMSMIKNVYYTMGLSSELMIALSIICLVIGFLMVVAGYWLWHMLRKGGLLGIILNVISIATSIPFLFISMLAIADAVDIVISIIVIVLIVVNWNILK